MSLTCLLVELAVVMGKETRDCPASQAMDNVAGKLYFFFKRNTYGGNTDTMRKKRFRFSN